MTDPVQKARDALASEDHLAFVEWHDALTELVVAHELLWEYANRLEDENQRLRQRVEEQSNSLLGEE